MPCMHAVRRKMLQGSKPYTQHYGKPAAISETKLHQLSTPKVTTVHEDTALLIEAGDYHKYARARANQLQTERSRREKQQVQEQQEAEHRACALDSYRNWKAQVRHIDIFQLTLDVADNKILQ